MAKVGDAVGGRSLVAEASADALQGACLLQWRVKQDNNGDTFLISPAQIPDIDQQAVVTEVTARKIGAWTPDENDHPDEPTF